MTAAADGDPSTDDALRDLLDAEELRAHVEARRRRASRRRQDEAVATLDDGLRALAASGAPVHLHRRSGPPEDGRICEVGRDYVAIETAGQVRLIPMRCIVGIRAPGPIDPGTAPPADSALALDLAERLRDLARRRVPLAFEAGSLRVAGPVRSVGHDVAVVAGRDRSETHVSLAAVDVVRVDRCEPRPTPGPHRPPAGQASDSPPLSPEPTTSG